MSRCFKSLVSTSLFMSLFFMPTMASAASTNDNDMNRNPGSPNKNAGQGTSKPNNSSQKWDTTSGYYSYNSQDASDDQEDQGSNTSGQNNSYNTQNRYDGQGTNYGYQSWYGNGYTEDWADHQEPPARPGVNNGKEVKPQGTDPGQKGSQNKQMWSSGPPANARQGWNSQGTPGQHQHPGSGNPAMWSSNQGAMHNHQAWQHGNAWNNPYHEGGYYSNAPRYYSGSDYYVSSPTQYGPSGYPAYQSTPPDGYYYNAGYNTGNNDYPYSQEYYDGRGMGGNVYYHVR